MTDRGWRQFGFGAFALGILAIPQACRAQSIGPTGEVMSPPAARQSTAGTSRSSSGGLFSPGGLNGQAGNPFANPYLNPYLNPLTTNQAATPQNAALYFLAAQQAAGGIGSGRLSGTRGGGTDPAPPKETRAKGSANVPGSGASSYFGRSLSRGGGASRFYNRQGNYYPGHSR